MKTFYNVVDTIETQLGLNPFVNTVTHGNIFDVDLNKQGLYPLAHLIVNSAQRIGPAWRISMSLIVMDLPESSDNEHYALDETLAVINKLMEKLSRGDLRDEKYHLVGTPSCIPFKDRFENAVIGWTVDFDVDVPNDMGHESD